MNILSSLLRRSAKRRAYKSLMLLDDRTLADIGVSRSEIRSQLSTFASADIVGLHTRA